ncbi:TetR/AcrR family transcriptional regulator [Nocardia gamkensis]|uniref:TetR/AcrR family transcriptional regulator n=1 Tax=Nocardia gamkensis TaxID=352869 RepID=UPI001FDF8C27|nr:TetR/AcrR family transcriptional regulator [Nocardia gamkensis]
MREPGELKLNAVAKACGIGQGTLYRHFPTREDLLAEVYRHEVDELVAAAAGCTAHPRLSAGDRLRQLDPSRGRPRWTAPRSPGPHRDAAKFGSSGW